MTPQCQHCGGRLEFIPEEQHVKCTHCFSVENIDFQSGKIPVHNFLDEEQEQSFSYHLIKCNSCGAEIIESSLVSDHCPYCTSVLVNKEFVNKNAPVFDGIIPFRISKSDAFEHIKKWKKSLYFAPNSFKKQFQQISFLKGAYIPYWLINTKTKVVYKGRCGQKSLTSSKTHWSSEEGELTTRIQNLALLATSSIPEYFKDISSVEFDEVVAEPWNNKWDFGQLLPLHEAFLYGFSTEVPQIGLKEVLAKQENKIRYELEQKVEKKIEKNGCDEGRVDKMSYTHLELNYRLVLLPVWIGAYKYKNRLYQILVNGQTGKVVGSRPVSTFKVVMMWILVILLIIGSLFISALDEEWIWILLGIIGLAVYIKIRSKKE